MSTPRITLPPLDLLCLGETLVDFLSIEEADSLSAAERFHRSLGGSPANIAAQTVRLGGSAGIISKVGVGAFGLFCREALRSVGVTTEYLLMDPAVHTTVVFVTRTPGTPDFEVFRAGDAQLRPTDVSLEALNRTRALHFSMWPLSCEPARSAVYAACEVATTRGILISLDPNYHPTFWADRNEAISVLRDLYPLITLTKPSLDDAARLFGEDHSPEEFLDLFHGIGAATVVLTMGARGVWLSTQDYRKYVPTPPAVIRSATGAGDAFWASFLLALLDECELLICVRFAQEMARRTLIGKDVRLAVTERADIYRSLSR